LRSAGYTVTAIKQNWHELTRTISTNYWIQTQQP
jgi:hypothetical protein